LGLWTSLPRRASRCLNVQTNITNDVVRVNAHAKAFLAYLDKKLAKGLIQNEKASDYLLRTYTKGPYAAG
jgi:hypothetical protein